MKVTKENKPQAEAQLMYVVEQTGTELVVLPRYMQVTPMDLQEDVRPDHQHSSLIPSILQGRVPVQKAFERGVKLICVTAHYVTADLDEGPIIEQDVARITHAQSTENYVSIGRDAESHVLDRAIHAHTHYPTFINWNRTVVFPASPGSHRSERMG
ncbi:formyltransferase family protein [Mesorhizobium sp. WSM3862]|uniref:formyltransferase family protein n=1 Tax=Mesorhizobium sp. WSM3862 TaxID=632858 RepID=UPI0032AFB37A